MLIKNWFWPALLVTTAALSAQDRAPLQVTFGELLPTDLAALPQGPDSLAEAYVLYDQEHTRVDLDNTYKWTVERKVHRRIKLIRSSAFHRAMIWVEYWPKSERVYDVEALIYLPGGTRYRLPPDAFIRDRRDDEVSLVTWTFPRLAEGAVIEYRYTHTSERVTVPQRFFFQEDIPIRYTEYGFSHPETFAYVSLGSANNFDVLRKTKRTLTYGSRSEKSVDQVFGYYDMPALREELYTNNIVDHLPNVRFQLRAYRTWNGAVTEVFSDWPQTAKKVADWDDFGRAYTNRSASADAWTAAEPLLAGLTTDVDKARALYQFVARSVSWDGTYSWLSDQQPDKVLARATGSSGEMNLLLLALLRRAGLDAQPAILSPRGHGKAIEAYPLMAQYRHVLVVLKADGQEILLDVVEPRHPMGLPRAAALNHRAVVMDPSAPRWIDVSVPPASRSVQADITVDAAGIADVTIQSRLRSYYALGGRNLSGERGKEETPVLSDILRRYPETRVVSNSSDWMDGPEGDKRVDLRLSVPMAEVADDYLYLRPILLPSLEAALTDARERYYPIDFSYPWREQCVANITLPDGYEVEDSLPALRIRSEDGSVVCRLNASQEGRIVRLSFDVGMTRDVYQPEEYAMLKTLFDKIIDAQESVLALRRTK